MLPPRRSIWCRKPSFKTNLTVQVVYFLISETADPISKEKVQNFTFPKVKMSTKLFLVFCLIIIAIKVSHSSALLYSGKVGNFSLERKIGNTSDTKVSNTM